MVLSIWLVSRNDGLHTDIFNVHIIFYESFERMMFWSLERISVPEELVEIFNWRENHGTILPFLKGKEQSFQIYLEASAKSYKFALISFTNILYDFQRKIFHVKGKISSYYAWI